MENPWTRRSNSSKLSLATNVNGANGTSSGDSLPRSAAAASSSATSSKRSAGDASSHGKAHPLSAGPGSGLTSPTGASSAFGLGSGAFASFGAAKTPRSSSSAAAAAANPPDASSSGSGSGSASAGAGAGTTSAASNKPGLGITTTKDAAASASSALPKPVTKPPSMAPISESKASTSGSGSASSPQVHVLKDAWSFWYRPPISKAHGFIEYENTLHGIATVRTAEQFWEVYSHLKRPSALPVVSDYHLFKKDIRPIWEDEVNRKGGKWVVRMKKGVADRYWEDLLLSLVGDQFGDAGEDVCGAVLSMRNGEDILSIWTRTDGGRVLKIREIMKHVLNFPANTRVEFKSHDSSIQQRTAIDEQRREKANQHHNTSSASEKRTMPAHKQAE